MRKKIYLLTEHQILAIKENVTTEIPDLFQKGDHIRLLAPVEGYQVPVKSVGVVAHVDAIGTIRAQFSINGSTTLVPINPDVDEIAKVNYPPTPEAMGWAS